MKKRGIYILSRQHKFLRKTLDLCNFYLITQITKYRKLFSMVKIENSIFIKLKNISISSLRINRADNKTERAFIG